MQRTFASLAEQDFDLFVCGGGIYGAWTAYDAALRGLQVAIVDQGDWASGTSSASSKLIHGGLRYLQTHDFKLVRKALTEREMLLQAAPHRVWPLRFGIPVYQDSRFNRLQLKAGLFLYDLLGSNKQASEGHCYFSRQQFAEKYPRLDASSLVAGFTYADAQTDDVRLVLELIDGAQQAGAVCVNYCEVLRYQEAGVQVYGVVVKDRVSGEVVNVSARQVVNTTGRWMTELKQVRPWCRLSKGIHIVLPKVLGRDALLLTAKADGRVFFMIPWYGLTLVGTTDSNYSDDLDRLTVEKDEIDYLLSEANHFFPGANWTQEDILGQFAGLRVLRQSAQASPASISRDWELKTLGNGMHVSLGGKITSAREDAASIVDSVVKQLGVNQICTTRGKDFPWKPSETYLQWCGKQLDQARRLGIDRESADWLIKRHGAHTDRIFRLIEDQADLAQRIIPGLPFIQADLVFCAQHEMVVHLEDLLRRRIPLFILAKISLSELRELAEMASHVLGWADARTHAEVELCRQQWLH